MKPIKNAMEQDSYDANIIQETLDGADSKDPQ